MSGDRATDRALWHKYHTVEDDSEEDWSDSELDKFLESDNGKAKIKELWQKENGDSLLPIEALVSGISKSTTSSVASSEIIAQLEGENKKLKQKVDAIEAEKLKALIEVKKLGEAAATAHDQVMKLNNSSIAARVRQAEEEAIFAHTKMKEMEENMKNAKKDLAREAAAAIKAANGALKGKEAISVIQHSPGQFRVIDHAVLQDLLLAASQFDEGASFREKKKIIEEVRKEHEEELARLRREHEENMDAHHEVHVHEDEVAHLRTQLKESQLNEEKAERKARNLSRDLERKLGQLRRQMEMTNEADSERFRKQILSLREELEEERKSHKSEVDELETYYKTTTKSLELKAGEAEASEKIVVSLSAEVANYKRKAKEAAGETRKLNSALGAQIQKSQEEMGVLENQLEKVSAEATNQGRRAKEAAEEIGRLSAALDASRAHSKTLENQLKEASTEAADYTKKAKEVAATLSKMEDLKSTVQLQKSELLKLESLLLSEGNKNEEAKMINSKLKLEIESLETKCLSLEEEKSILIENAVQGHELTKKELDNMIDKLKIEMASAQEQRRNEVANLQNQISSMEESKQLELASLRASLEAKYKKKLREVSASKVIAIEEGSLRLEAAQNTIEIMETRVKDLERKTMSQNQQSEAPPNLQKAGKQEHLNDQEASEELADDGVTLVNEGSNHEADAHILKLEKDIGALHDQISELTSKHEADIDALKEANILEIQRLKGLIESHKSDNEIISKEKSVLALQVKALKLDHASTLESLSLQKKELEGSVKKYEDALNGMKEQLNGLSETNKMQQIKLHEIENRSDNDFLKTIKDLRTSMKTIQEEAARKQRDMEAQLEATRKDLEEAQESALEQIEVLEDTFAEKKRDMQEQLRQQVQQARMEEISNGDRALNEAMEKARIRQTTSETTLKNRISALELQLGSLSSKFKEEVSDLKINQQDEISDLHSEKEQLQEDNERLMEEIEIVAADAESALADHRNRLGHLQAQTKEHAERLELKILKLEHMNRQGDLRVEQLEGQLIESREKTMKLEQSLAKFGSRLWKGTLSFRKKEANMTDMYERERLRAEQEARHAADEHAAYKREHNLLLKEHANLEAEKEQTRLEHEAYEKEHKEALREHAALEKEKKKSEREHTEYLRKHQQMESELRRLSSEKDKLKSKAWETASARDAEMQRVEAESAQAAKRLKDIEAKLNAKVNEVESLKKGHAKMAARVWSLGKEQEKRRHSQGLIMKEKSEKIEATAKKMQDTRKKMHLAEANKHVKSKNLKRKSDAAKMVSKGIPDSSTSLPEEPISEPTPNELPSGWVSHVDNATGQTYYHNPELKITQWEKPVKEASSDWEVHMDPATGYPYYVNLATNAVQWEMPPGLEGEDHAADSSNPKVISHHWVKMQRDERHGRKQSGSSTVSEALRGIRKAINRHGTKVICSYPGCTHEATHGDPQDGEFTHCEDHQESHHKKLTIEYGSSRGSWIEIIDNEGRTVYYNQNTDVLQISRPNGWVKMMAKNFGNLVGLANKFHNEKKNRRFSFKES